MPASRAKSRAKGPDDYAVEFLSTERLQVITTRASSPWAPVLEKFVKSGEAALQIKVSNAREGNRLASQLRKGAGLWFPKHKFASKTIAIPTSGSEKDYFAFLIITARPEE